MAHVGEGTRSVVVMGPSGAGKTTFGLALARAWGASFVDADDHHSLESVAKMSRGQPLDESERGPWLARLAALLDVEPGRVVLACSALRRAHRQALGVDGRRRRLVFLDTQVGELAERLRSRRGHFAGPALLASQLETLEPPTEDEAALWLAGDAPLAPSLERALAWLDT